jgi:hypothetical protein
MHRHTPFVFASGDGNVFEADAYASVPRCVQPVDFALLGETLAKPYQASPSGNGS